MHSVSETYVRDGRGWGGRGVGIDVMSMNLSSRIYNVNISVNGVAYQSKQICSMIANQGLGCV